MTKTFSVKSNATRSAKKAFPAGDFEVYAVGDEWAFRQTGLSDAQQEIAAHEVEQEAEAPLTKADADLHDTFKAAYAHFNATLFGGRLPECMILLHRKKNARGYFWAEQWKHRTSGEGRHEIAMNPDNFGARSTKDILSTLVHEMTHLEQQVFGKPAKGGYHDKAWVQLMRNVGLLPYAIGVAEPRFVDGAWDALPKKNTGTKVTHVVEPGMAFDVACDALLATGVEITWSTHEPTALEKAIAKKKRASKTKFTCPDCGQNAWAKPDATLGCWECGIEMEDAGE